MVDVAKKKKVRSAECAARSAQRGVRSGYKKVKVQCTICDPFSSYRSFSSGQYVDMNRFDPINKKKRERLKLTLLFASLKKTFVK
jgi:hypothetical protein